MVGNLGVSNNAGSVLIVGAGIGGIGSAQLLAQMGYKVYLLDRAPGIGGSMHLLDRTFPTDSCGMCIMLPDQPSYCPTLECGRHPNIEILSYAEVESLEGEAGDFRALVKHLPRYVDIACNNCGLCVEVCPVERPDDHEGRLHVVKAIYRPPTRAVPDAYVIDMDYCTRCGKCVEVCPIGAIDLEMAERRSEIEVGAVILSPGYQANDARIKGEFGYGYYDNVLTSIEFERMVSLAGSTQAHLMRPSDGAAPHRVAFIQCVGSRDESTGYPYCSSVCCMYTAKQLTATKEIAPDLEATVFFMDIRTFGKAFEPYFNRVENLPGVTYRRCMVSSIKEVPQTRDLRVAFLDEGGTLLEEDFGMVVLAVGLAPPEGFQALASRLGVELNEFGFCATDRFSPHETTRPGVFVGGAFREPKEISRTVTEAAGVVADVARSRKQGARSIKQEAGGENLGPAEVACTLHPVPERDVSEQELRVGVFVCTCRGQVSEVVDVGAVAEYAGLLNGVVLAKVVEDACGADLDLAKEAIEEQGLNRVVMVGCSPHLYQPEFAALMRQAGLNPQLLERADIREGCAWVHRDVPERATAKAKAVVEMAVTKATFHRAVSPSWLEPSRRALVIGGGLAGMTAALELAELGFEADLVERGEELGGNLRTEYYTLDAGKPQELLRSLIERVEANEMVKVYLNTEVRELGGSKGSFLTTLALSDGSPVLPIHRPDALTGGRRDGASAVEGDEVLEHGAIVVATGAQPATTTEYLYGQHERVVTQREMEERIFNAQYPMSNMQTVVMIQCVGSRDDNRPYCSRVCCCHAVKNALKLKELNPELRVFVLYQELRTYGFHELYYREARDKGVIFIRYELPDKPRVEPATSSVESAAGDGLRVRLREPILGQEIALDADLLVLSTGIDPYDNRDLSELLDVPLDEDGFFQEAHPKMRPVDFLREGVFLCGLAHSPRLIDETISQAKGAAARAAALLGLPRLESRDTLVTVNARLCSFCGLCVEACSYEARYLDYDERVAKVIDVLCKGCGVCAMVCPNKASTQVAFEPKQMLTAIDALVMAE